VSVACPCEGCREAEDTGRRPDDARRTCAACGHAGCHQQRPGRGAGRVGHAPPAAASRAPRWSRPAEPAGQQGQRSQGLRPGRAQAGHASARPQASTHRAATAPAADQAVRRGGWRSSAGTAVRSPCAGAPELPPRT
jgi:hypothetical protein